LTNHTIQLLGGQITMKKNIAIVMLAIIALVCFGGWVHSAQEAESNYKVMMSEAKIIRQLKGIE
ncbi:hypothetical protein, partial [Limosilactobacillus reuteri]